LPDREAVSGAALNEFPFRPSRRAPTRAGRDPHRWPERAALAGDTPLVALLTNVRRVRDSGFGDGPRAPGVVAGPLSPDDGHANPRPAGPAFARAAQRAGAKVIEYAEGDACQARARWLRRAHRRRCTASRRSVAGVLRRLVESHREPVRRNGVARSTRPADDVTEPLPYAIAPSIGVSTPIEHESLCIRQVRRGNIVFGGGLKGPAHADVICAYVKPDNTLRQLRELRSFVPAFERVQLICVWSGSEGYVSDWQPVMGPSATTPGVHYAFGFSGEGFATAPVWAR
jgi:sarcosine oxidase, subunit beta